MTDKQDKLRARHAKELADADTEAAILAALPADIPWRVHVYKLYGTAASATWKTPSGVFDYDKGRAPTVDDVIVLADKLAPEPLTLVKDGSKSFRNSAHVEALPEEKKARWREECDGLAPFKVDVETFQAQTFSFRWQHKLVVKLPPVSHVAGPPIERELIVEIRCELPAHAVDFLATLNMEAAHYAGHGPVSHWEQCSIHPTDSAHTVYKPDGESVAGLESPIRWASGGPEYPNKFTLYWMRYGDTVATVADLLRSARGDEVAS